MLENWELLYYCGRLRGKPATCNPSHQQGFTKGTPQPQRTYEQRNRDQELKICADLQLSRFFCVVEALWQYYFAIKIIYEIVASVNAAFMSHHLVGPKTRKKGFRGIQ